MVRNLLLSWRNGFFDNSDLTI